MSNNPRPLKITEYETIDCKNVWANHRDMSSAKVLVLRPDHLDEPMFTLNLEDHSTVFLSNAQAKAIALAVAKVAAGEA